MNARLAGATLEELGHPAGGAASPVVLHVHDHPVAQAEDSAPLKMLPFGRRPGEPDRHLAVVLADIFNPEVAVTGALAPLNLRLENLPGLGWPVSGRTRAPETPARPAAPPLHVRVHERDERLDVARTQGLVGLANLFHRSPILELTATGRDRSYVLDLGAVAGLPAKRRPPESPRVIDQEQDELEGVGQVDEVEVGGRRERHRLRS